MTYDEEKKRLVEAECRVYEIAEIGGATITDLDAICRVLADILRRHDDEDTLAMESSEY